MIRPSTCWIALGLGLVAATVASAQDPAGYFRQNCASCHSIGGGRVIGPDLHGVTGRKDRAWLAAFIVNPQAVIDSGDPYAQQILAEAHGVVMPAPAGITPALAAALLDFIDAQSGTERSEFGGTPASDRPFGPEDVALGHALFTGERRLGGGGPPCLSCHSVGGVGAMGGGKLGPDLTLAFERLNGRAGMGAWLGAPATPTMQRLFRDGPLATGEIESLLAFFDDAARRRAEADPVAPLTFFLLGLGGAAAGVVICDLAWLGRFRGVRRRMVDAATRRH